MSPTDFGKNTAENAKCLKGQKVLFAPTNVHCRSDTSFTRLLVLQQVAHQVFLFIREKFNSSPIKNNFYRSK